MDEASDNQEGEDDKNEEEGQNKNTEAIELKAKKAV